MWILLFVACQSTPPDPAPDVPTEGSLQLLTYNVAGLPDGLSSADGDGIDRMTQIRPLLDDFEVVGPDEVEPDKGVYVRFPGNKDKVACFLTQLSRTPP